MADHDDDDEKLFLRPLDAVARGQKLPAKYLVNLLAQKLLASFPLIYRTENFYLARLPENLHSMTEIPTFNKFFKHLQYCYKFDCNVIG